MCPQLIDKIGYSKYASPMVGDNIEHLIRKGTDEAEASSSIRDALGSRLR